MDYPIPLVAWTGGDTPPRRFADPMYRAMRRALLAEQMAIWRSGWGDEPKLDTVRIFANRAKMDAWRSFTEHAKS